MPAKILIVDDRPANMIALEALLAPLDRPIVRATSGEEALRQILTTDFAVILLDVLMPGMDGFETASVIRARPRTREIPIIFLTAFDSEFHKARKAYDLGAFDFITKPYDPDIVRHKVAAFVRLFEQAELLRQQAEELYAQRSAVSKAEEDKRTRDVFIGVLGHDLRNPLGAIANAAVLLQSARDLPERHRSTVERIARSAKRMERLINDVLDFTRGELAGGIPVSRESADLETICRHVIDELQPTHRDRPITLTVRGRTDVYCDTARVAQLLSNLIGNALQHASRGDVRVVVGAVGDPIRLMVTNMGCIPADVLPRLFQPFRRGDSSSAGLGLGLYIVREIACAHGGRVTVDCDTAVGETVLTVELPRGGLNG